MAYSTYVPTVGNGLVSITGSASLSYINISGAGTVSSSLDGTSLTVISGASGGLVTIDQLNSLSGWSANATNLTTTGSTLYSRDTDISGVLYNQISGATYSPLTTQTGNFTISLDMAGQWIRCSGVDAMTGTIGPQATYAWLPATEIFFEQQAAGAFTIITGEGVYLNNAGATAKTRAQYSVLGLKRVISDTWTLFGDTAAS